MKQVWGNVMNEMNREWPDETVNQGMFCPEVALLLGAVVK